MAALEASLAAGTSRKDRGKALSEAGEWPSEKAETERGAKDGRRSGTSPANKSPANKSPAKKTAARLPAKRTATAQRRSA